MASRADLPAPTSPARPTISPACSVRLTGSGEPWCCRPRTSRTTSAGGDLALVVVVAELAADHHPRQRRLRSVRDRQRSDQRPVAQHGHHVGDGVDLLQPMGDEDHADATGPQPCGSHGTAPRLRPRSASSSPRRRSTTFDRIARARAIETTCCRSSGRLPTRRRGSRSPASSVARTSVAVRFAVAQSTTPRRVGHPTQEDVLGDRQLGDERDLLGDRADPAG